jgi:hypothetical protein
LASEDFVTSRDLSLITNGGGWLGNNYNFPSLTHTTDGPVCGQAAFASPLTVGSNVCSEFIPVDPLSRYRLSCRVQNGQNDGTEYQSNSRFYMGVACYDAAKSLIGASMYTHWVGAADTELAVEVKPGDTSITLVNAIGWNNAGSGTQRHMTWWPYTDAFCTYGDYTYSRNTTGTVSAYISAGLWGSGGVSGNTLTLTSPWPASLGTLPVGTKVRNSLLGAAYQYCVRASSTAPNELTEYAGEIQGFNTEGTVNDYYRFPYGTVYVRPITLYNYTTAGSRWFFMNYQLTKSNFFYYGGYNDYTPSWSASTTDPTLGDGLLEGVWSQVGEVLFIDIQLTIGSTTNLGSGVWKFGVPDAFTSFDLTAPLAMGVMSILDDSESQYWSGWSYYGAPAPAGVYALSPGNTPGSPDVLVSDDGPIPWTEGDKLRISLRCRLSLGW